MITLEQFLTQIPKAELLYHLFGGVRLEVMKGGIAALNFLYPLLRELEDYELVAKTVLEDAKNSGIRYIEFFWNPNDTELSYDEVTNTLIKVFDWADRRCRRNG